MLRIYNYISRGILIVFNIAYNFYMDVSRISGKRSITPRFHNHLFPGTLVTNITSGRIDDSNFVGSNHNLE